MKSIGKPIALLGLAVALASPAMAQDGIKEQVDQFFIAVDANGDGKIVRKEIEDFCTKTGQGLNELLAAFLGSDTDENMEVTKPELQAMLERDAKGEPPIFSDKDFELLVELPAKDTWEQLLETYDSNGDKLLTCDESGDDPAMFNAADLNKDGKMDLGEFTKLSAAEAKKGVYGDNPAPANPGQAEPGKSGDGGTANKEAFALYTKKGRSWTHKSVAKAGGQEIVSYVKYEVVDSSDTAAKLKTTPLDASKNPYPGVDGTVVDIPFVTGAGQMPSGGHSAPGVKTYDETITVAGGTFECLVTEAEYGGMKSKTWMAKKYMGLVVKMESDAASMELVEFKD